MVAQKEVIFVKPQTYMNLSGTAVKEVAKAFDVSPSNCLVIYDTIHLPLGRLRARPGGGAGGQKGMADIHSELRSMNVPQLRVGVGNPDSQRSHVDFVLASFDSEERDLLPAIQKAALQMVESWLTVGMEETMQKFNGVNISSQ